MRRWEIINALIEAKGYKSFLEIGVDSGITNDQVICEHKVGVDPNKATPATYHCKSDTFFGFNDETFDIVFIDGLHIAEQVTKDINNALSVLTEHGCIVLHDCKPLGYEAQIVPREQKIWNGDVWKAFVKARAMGLEMLTVDEDCGCGIITTRKSPKFVPLWNITWVNFEDRMDEWLNLKSAEEFREWLNDFSENA